jgi:hypothetical protein
MTTNANSQIPVISYDDVYQLLKKLHDDPELEKSGFKNLFLVQQCCKNNPLFSNSQALRKVFTDVLDILKTGTEKQEYYAFILKGRFWDEYSITRMITSERLNQMPQRTFSNEQKRAIQVFCEVLTAQEQQFRKQNPELLVNGVETAQSLVEKSSTTTTTIPPRMARRNQILRLAIGLLLIIVLVLGTMVIKYRSESKSSSAVPPSTLVLNGSETQTPTPYPVFCQEKAASPVVVTDPQFVRSQGLITFDKETNQGILNNKIRTLYAVQKGLWIGYFSTDQNPTSGVSFYDRETKRLLNCSQVGITEGQNVNDIVVDQNNGVWVGMEKGGVAWFNGSAWRVFKTDDGLPSNWIYGLFVDDDNAIWAATFKGVTRFDGKKWNTMYTVENGSLVNDRVHIITMDSSKNLWIGYIEDGVSLLHKDTGKWEHFSAAPGGLSGNKIRNILIQPDKVSGSDNVWIATFDGGLSRYANGKWTSYTDGEGLPSREVRDIAVDKHGRVWIATGKGVMYWVNNEWHTYDTLETNNIVFGSNCEGKEGYCLDDENIFTATNLLGLTHSRIPLPDDGLDVVKVCFVKEDKTEICPDLVKDKSMNTVIANYPDPLEPGAKFFMKVTVSPFKPYKLLDSRGDQLINIDADSAKLYGTFPRIPVSGSIESGQEYTFIDTNNPFVTPELEDTVSATHSSNWRMWMQTRLIGPIIRVTFTVNSTP